MTYLYCLLPAASDPPPPDLAGIAGEPVRRLATARVAAWVGTTEDVPMTRTLEVARRHDAVVRAALRTGATPLPARAGQRFADDAACLAELGRREPMIADALARVAGCVEMTVHVSVPRPVERSTAVRAAGGTGRDYLEQLRARHQADDLEQRSASVRERLARAVQGIAKAEAVSARSSEGEVVVSHLVPRDVIDQYRKAVTGMDRDTQPGEPRIGGPYAPYSFSEIAGG